PRHSVRARFPRWEAHDVAGPERARSLRRPHLRRSVDHDEPFLDAVVVVVRERVLAGRDLVDGAPDLRAADLTRDARRARAPAVAFVFVPELAGEQVEDVRHPVRIISRRMQPLAGT